MTKISFLEESAKKEIENENKKIERAEQKKEKQQKLDIAQKTPKKAIKMLKDYQSEGIREDIDENQPSPPSKLHTQSIVSGERTELREDAIPLLEGDYRKFKMCPKCNSKLQKFKVVKEKNLLTQEIYCKNPHCKFNKKYAFRI